MSALPTPPSWSQGLLRLFLSRSDSETVSGDLLEHYRESIRSERSQSAADWWYLRQVLGFVVRETRFWAAWLGLAYISRQAWDWFAPTNDFYTRSALSTAVHAGILLACGFWAAWRSGSLLAGTVAGFAATAIGAVVSILGSAVLLAIWHDPQTTAAINGSGGLDEAFWLPVMIILPGALIGTMGGVLGAALRRVGPARSA